jgi:hypothetical protein
MLFWYLQTSVQARFYCGLFHLLDLYTALDCKFFFYLTGHSDFDYGLFRFTELDTLILTTDFCVWNGAHSWCDRSTRDFYSSWVPSPTSGLSMVRVCPIFQILISYGTYETDHCSLYYPFIMMKKKWQFGVIDGHIHKVKFQSRGPRWPNISILHRNYKRSQRLPNTSRKISHSWFS